MDTDAQSTKRKREEDSSVVNKKKKTFVGRSTFVNEDENEDIIVSGWFYQDCNGGQQGPFTTKEMKEWYIAGFFFGGTLVRRVYDADFKAISSCEEFKRTEQRITHDKVMYQDLPEMPRTEAQQSSDSQKPSVSTEKMASPAKQKEEKVTTEEKKTAPIPTSQQAPVKAPAMTPVEPPVMTQPPASLSTEEKVAWQQYQQQQQYQFYMYLQHCQQEQEKERLKQEEEEKQKIQQEKDEMEREQQRQLEILIEAEKLKKAPEPPNPYYEQFGGGYLDPALADEPTLHPQPGADSGSYSQVAYFNSTNGKFAAETPEQHWKGKNVPTDRDGRMMSHYFDFEGYQEQMRAAAEAGPTKKPKITKKMIKAYKKRKIDKKRDRILMIPS